jgi:hypothetical protein
MMSSPFALALALAAADVEVDDKDELPPRTSEAAFRLAVDVSMPGGLAAGLHFEPVPALRFSLAALYNVLGFGVRGGVDVLPFGRSPIHPLIGVEAGHHFEGEAKRLLKSAPDRLSYTFLTGLLGVEARILRVTLHAAVGASGVWAQSSSLTLYQRVTIDQLDVTGVVFAARLGLSVRLF